MAGRLRKGTALVDWDTARRIAPRELRSSMRRHDHVITKIQDGIANYLGDRFGVDVPFRINWRIYHGWHAGKTKTQDRVDFDTYAVQARSRTVRSISFGTDFSFSETLSCTSVRTPIFDTLRYDNKKDGYQKMVDAILMCDLLHMSRCREADLLIVVANDDDFVPALFTAEAWRADVVLLHTRDSLNPHLQLKNLAARMRFK